MARATIPLTSAPNYSLPNNGRIDGSAGSDTLDYGDYLSGIMVDLSAGTAAGTHGISNIENVIGTLYADDLTGNTQDNRLEGGAGDDTYSFSGAIWGDNQIIDDSGTDILDLSGVSVNLSFEIGLLDLNIDSTGGSLSTLNTIENAAGRFGGRYLRLRGRRGTGWRRRGHLHQRRQREQHAWITRLIPPRRISTWVSTSPPA